MKRVLLLIPEGLTFDMLSQQQQDAISNVFGQYVNPMPATLPKDGTQIVDALASDAFDPANMVALGLDWTVLAMWQWGGKANPVYDSNGDFLEDAESPNVITTLDEAELVARLAPDVDIDGNETPRALYEPNKWAGWSGLI